MLEYCKERVEKCGFKSRCNFHHGYLDTLPDTEKFHAATSILVSHFIVDSEERILFFKEIAERLLPGGSLVTTDLCSDMSRTTFTNLVNNWRELLRYSGLSNEEVEERINSLGVKISAKSVVDLETILLESRFVEPTLFFQAFLNHAWYSKVAH